MPPRGVGNELAPVTVALDELEPGVVHVGHDGDGRNIWVASRKPGQNVPRRVHAVFDAYAVEYLRHRRGHALLVKGHGGLGAQPGQEIKGLFSVVHAIPFLVCLNQD